jgi:hypothetical protein
MKKILIQLDSDRLASTFDSIVARDSGADSVQSYGGVKPSDIRSLIQGAIFTRGIPDLKNLAVWIGGSDVDAGEQMLAEAIRAFFGPFKISLMLDSNGCNTTASTAVAKLARQTDLQGRNALVVGPGPVGLRAALLLAGEGCCVRLSSIPPVLLGDRFNENLAQRTLESARAAAKAFSESASTASGGMVQMRDIADSDRLDGLLNEAEILVAAGPAGLRLISSDSWSAKPGLEWMVDFNLVEPLGIEGIKSDDDFAEYDGKKVLGALAIGNPKMKVHKACIAGLFESNDLVLDTEGVYAVAKKLI